MAITQRLPLNDLQRHNAPFLQELIADLTAVARSGWYILGQQVQEFEAAFAGYCGVAHCVGVGNGTDALELALRACGAGPGREVVTVANAGGYATAAIRAAGADPLYVEVEAGSMLMDIDSLEQRLTPRTSAIVVTHLYGRMVDMPRLTSVARRAGVAVVEDCAHAHGARMEGRCAGAWGTLGCFSFYPTKNLGALGDAGAVVTNDAALAELVRRLRQYGWTSRFVSEAPGGRNSRLDEMQAAVLLRKLPHLEEWNARRRAIARVYDWEFRDLDLETPGYSGADAVTHLYVMRTGRREELRTRLRELGIATEVHYPVPDYRQNSERGRHGSDCRLPVTEECCRRVVTLPCFPEMTDAEVEKVVAAVREAD
jgi:aminotransferase EvaB